MTPRSEAGGHVNTHDAPGFINAGAGRAEPLRTTAEMVREAARVDGRGGGMAAAMGLIAARPRGVGASDGYSSL